MMFKKRLSSVSSIHRKFPATELKAQRDVPKKEKIGIPPFYVSAMAGLCLFAFCLTAHAQTPAENDYVGSASCQPCHEEQYESFQTYARKSHSFESVQKMAKGLTPEEIKDCYSCHTTGYGEPSGFVSEQLTPELKNAGCEACHGPGKLHIETQDPDNILKEVTLEVCQKCHTDDRVTSFRYTPVIHAGCH